MATVEERLVRQLAQVRRAQERSDEATRRLKAQGDELEARISGSDVADVAVTSAGSGAKPLSQMNRQELLEAAAQRRVRVPDGATVRELRAALAPTGFESEPEPEPETIPPSIEAVPESEVQEPAENDGQ